MISTLDKSNSNNNAKTTSTITSSFSRDSTIIGRQKPSSCPIQSLCILFFAQLLLIHPSVSFLPQLPTVQYSHNLNSYPTSTSSSLLSPSSTTSPICTKRKRTRCKLRNFDLPEALIFYGMDTIIDRNNDSDNDDIKPTVQPGVVRLVKESKEVKTPIIVLSEHHTMEEISTILDSAACESDDTDNMFFSNLHNEDHILHYRSSLEEYVVDPMKRTMNFHSSQQENDKEGDDDEEEEDDEYEYPPTFLGKGIGHAPSPASLMDAIHTVWIEPRGFGGSSGFGTKYADAVRNPLPQHCVVFVSKSSDDHNHDKIRNASINKDTLNTKYDGSGSISRDRSLACRMSGVRVMYIEGIGGSCTAEDVSDGIVESLGTIDDWSMVTMDDISTPGSFWLNMAQPKDEYGDFVNAYDVVEHYENLRTKDDNDDCSNVAVGDDNDLDMVSEEMDEDEIQSILADLDSL